MTEFTTVIAGLLAVAVVTAGGLLDGGSGGEAAGRPALIADAALGRDGRDLVDRRLEAADADVRLPSTPAEARANLRYLAAQGRPLIVAGPETVRAANATGVSVQTTRSLAAALRALRR